jgi:hypothetical protein
VVGDRGLHLAAIEARGEDRVILVWNADALNQAPAVVGTAKMKFQTVSDALRTICSRVVAAPDSELSRFPLHVSGTGARRKPGFFLPAE